VFTIAAIIALACLALPLSIFARMVLTGRRVRAEIHSSMSMHRRTCCGHLATRKRNR
jgi:hypothetical protein